jgi:hypothetical protein
MYHYSIIRYYETSVKPCIYAILAFCLFIPGFLVYLPKQLRVIGVFEVIDLFAAADDAAMQYALAIAIGIYSGLDWSHGSPALSCPIAGRIIDVFAVQTVQTVIGVTIPHYGSTTVFTDEVFDDATKHSMKITVYRATLGE